MNIDDDCPVARSDHSTPRLGPCYCFQAVKAGSSNRLSTNSRQTEDELTTMTADVSTHKVDCERSQLHVNHRSRARSSDQYLHSLGFSPRSWDLGIDFGFRDFAK